MSQETPTVSVDTVNIVVILPAVTSYKDPGTKCPDKLKSSPSIPRSASLEVVDAKVVMAKVATSGISGKISYSALNGNDGELSLPTDPQYNSALATQATEGATIICLQPVNFIFTFWNNSNYPIRPVGIFFKNAIPAGDRMVQGGYVGECDFPVTCISLLNSDDSRLIPATTSGWIAGGGFFVKDARTSIDNPKKTPSLVAQWDFYLVFQWPDGTVSIVDPDIKNDGGD